jgi:hypothetical protein
VSSVTPQYVQFALGQANPRILTVFLRPRRFLCSRMGEYRFWSAALGVLIRLGSEGSRVATGVFSDGDAVAAM